MRHFENGNLVCRLSILVSMIYELRCMKLPVVQIRYDDDYALTDAINIISVRKLRILNVYGKSRPIMFQPFGFSFSKDNII